MNFFETVENLFKDWRYDHPRVLYALIRSLKPETVLEIGTYRGYAACYMAQALKENGRGHLHCIDNFCLTDHVAKYGDPILHWQNNIRACGVADWVTLIVGDSDKVQWPSKVDFAYIDGWHSYDAARNDFHKCASLGAKTICLDDTISCVGPRLLIQDIKHVHSWEWSVFELPSDNGLSICTRIQKVRDVTFSQELPNNPGVDLTVLTPEQRKQHFEDCRKATGTDYGVPGIGVPS